MPWLMWVRHLNQAFMSVEMCTMHVPSPLLGMWPRAGLATIAAISRSIRKRFGMRASKPPSERAENSTRAACGNIAIISLPIKEGRCVS